MTSGGLTTTNHYIALNTPSFALRDTSSCLTNLVEIGILANPNVRGRDEGVGHPQDLVESFVGADLMSERAHIQTHTCTQKPARTKKAQL